MLTHQTFKDRTTATIRSYIAERYELTLDDAEVESLCNAYKNSPPCTWNDCSIEIWVKTWLLRKVPAHFLPETKPPGDIARFLAYMDGNFIFEGYPEEYRRREQEKIDAHQAYIRNPCKDTLLDLQVVFGRRAVPSLAT